MVKPKRKTLKLNEGVLKKVRFKGTDVQDMTAYHKAYQLGAFEIVHQEDFSKENLYSKEQFEKVFAAFVANHGVLSVTFFGFKDDLELPIGVGIFWQRGRVLQLTNLVWFPWANTRQVFLSTFNFFDSFRQTIHSNTGRPYKILEFAEEKDERFFDRLADMGVLEKVGKLDGIYPDGKAVLYATKEVKDK